MRCHVCRTEGVQEGDTCPYCGAKVRSVLGKGQPLPSEIVREVEEKRATDEADRIERKKKRYRDHALAGGIIFLAFGGVLLLMRLLQTIMIAAMGRVGGDGPWGLFLGLLVVILLTLTYGALMGVLASRFDTGLAATGAAGAVLLLVEVLALGLLPYLVGSANQLLGALMLPLFGFGTGGLIAVHVQSDRDR